MTPRQCEIAGESYTACLLARCGYDVLVQYGANQPHYDLVAVKGQRILLVSVKGSKDGGWPLAVKKEDAGYHEAIDLWLSGQRDDLIYIMVQFLQIPLDQAPRVYVARPPEMAAYMKSQRHGLGLGSLQEDIRLIHPRSRYDHRIPVSWTFSKSRIDAI